MTHALVKNENLECIEKELHWLNQCIEYRFVDYFQQDQEVSTPVAPVYELDSASYASIIKTYDLSKTQRLILILALAPHLRPSIFDLFSTKNKVTDKIYTEFGGTFGSKYGGFIPTVETAAFILSGNSLEGRLEVADAIEESSLLSQQNWIKLGERNPNEPVWSAELLVSDEFRVYATEGKEYLPAFSTSFPAQLIRSSLSWEDAIFPDSIRAEFDMIESWIRNEHTIMHDWSLDKFLKKGYRALFYGPPGTGKSMAAALLGKSTARKVFRVDLSNVISKYIGETEKNLARLFDIAENKKWILFFDEADALFSKRTNASSSNDVFANQQVAYLLQRIEDFNGLTILASNFKDNMDDAFLRRFQSIVHFPKPGYSERLQLWKHYFSLFDTQHISFEQLAEKYELTGGSLVNILRYCAQHAAEIGDKKLDTTLVHHAIRRELSKEGKAN